MKEKKPISLNILLADDDKDDRFFFAKALKELSIPSKLITVGDGEKLMKYLSENSEHLPDLLFLDLNMPRKNGSECLAVIRSNEKFKHIPVIIYSTSINDTIADVLYEKGAHYYMHKCDFFQLVKCLELVLTRFKEGQNYQPSRDEFVISLVKV